MLWSEKLHVHMKQDIIDLQWDPINNCPMMIDNSGNDCRVNIHYYSKDFQDLRNTKYKDVRDRDILHCFLKEKDTLKDLSFRIIGYFWNIFYTLLVIESLSEGWAPPLLGAGQKPRYYFLNSR